MSSLAELEQVVNSLKDKIESLENNNSLQSRKLDDELLDLSTVYDIVSGIKLTGNGMSFLELVSKSKTVHPKGAWDFSNATSVIGVDGSLTVVAVGEDEYELTPAHNTEYRFGEMTSLAVLKPDAMCDNYITSLIFSIGEEGEFIADTESFFFLGTDCTNGLFAPTGGFVYEMNIKNVGAAKLSAIVAKVV